MKPNRGRLWARAVHFAGHAVMVEAVGLRLHNVTLRAASDYGRVSYQTATGHLATVTDETMFRYLAEKDVLVHMAGAAAETVYQIFAGDNVHPMDEARSKALLRVVEPSAAVVDEWLRYLERRARAVFEQKEPWTRVRKLAGALLEREKWSADDLQDLHAIPPTEETRWSPPTPEAAPGVPLDMLVNVWEVVDIPARAVERLEATGLQTVWQILHRTERDLLSLVNIGRTTIRQINASLASRGWAIGMYARGSSHAE